MRLFIKIEANGTVAGVDDVMNTIVETSVEHEESMVKDKLGKVIYSLENMGYSIDTHDLFTKVCDVAFGVQLKRDRYCTVYSDELVKISFKVA